MTVKKYKPFSKYSKIKFGEIENEKTEGKKNRKKYPRNILFWTKISTFERQLKFIELSEEQKFYMSFVFVFVVFGSDVTFSRWHMVGFHM